MVWAADVQHWQRGGRVAAAFDARTLRRGREALGGGPLQRVEKKEIPAAERGGEGGEAAQPAREAAAAVAASFARRCEECGHGSGASALGERRDEIGERCTRGGMRGRDARAVQQDGVGDGGKRLRDGAQR